MEPSKNEFNISLVMAGLMIGLLVAALDNSIMATAMPKVISSLGGMVYYVWPFTIYMLTSTIAIILFGKLSDLYGRKRILIAGIVLFVLSSVACGFSSNMLQLIIFRGIQGIGGGILITIPFIVVAELFPPRQRGKYTGILASVFGISNVLGPILGGVITDFMGWQWVFFVNVPVGVAAIVMLSIYFPHLKQVVREKVIDYAGLITMSLSFSSLCVALTYVRSSYLPEYVVGFLFIFAALMFILFIHVERRAVEPLLPMHLFKISVFNLSAVAMFLSNAVMFCGIIYIPLFIQKVLGISASGSGALITPMLVSLTVASLIAGQVISKTGTYKKMGVMAFGLITVGMVMATTITQSTGTAEILIYTTILGIGSGIMYPVFTVAIQNAVLRRDIGIATASSQFFRNVGATITLPIFGLIVNLTMNMDINAVSSVPVGPMITAIHNVFTFGIVMCIIGLIASLMLKDAVLSNSNDFNVIDEPVGTEEV
ncbi:major facilitator superfamily MFS_1 [Methanobacterium lacus]|uniref:Major facilitator superfamily MFS_1 n=1 Tax=Methanobacterium lacus (strain AL-21) TaxID=877455 RepID=F0TBX3_METLA|nr:MDR family MFS transporter [Methanobacterium lacus]ADZ10315.1 major facilitator superfamily MFS_1 [Methanobacterium lacus]